MSCKINFLTACLLFATPSFAAAEKLGKTQAEELIAKQFAALQAVKKPGLPDKLPEPVETQIERDKKVKVSGGKLDLGAGITMPYAVVLRGNKDAPDKRPLFIPMHGGGGNGQQPGPHTWEVNTREFQTQIQFALRLYQSDGVYLIPRMADDRLGRWWHKHNQTAFDQVIDHAILHWNVDPDRVYLMGISEGGYGTDILAPFMPDRFAAANAMAAGVGLANPPANLRNLPFRTDIGESDMQFDRFPMAVGFHKELERLHELDPCGYIHSLNPQAGRGHGIDYTKGVPWMVKHTRKPWPDKLLWINQTLDGLRRPRFYWLSFPKAPEKGDIRIEATADGKMNTITLDVSTLDAGNADGNRTHGKDNVAESKRTPLRKTSLDLLLNDALLDLDKPVTVIANGHCVFHGKVERSAEVITAALVERADPSACPTARLTVSTPE
jgi:hypothetical protein